MRLSLSHVSPALQPEKQDPSPLPKRFPHSRRWDKLPRWVRQALQPTVTETYMALVAAGRQRICVRHLAALRGVSERTVRYHLGAMEKARVIRVVRRRIGPRRNAPNVIVLLDIDGSDIKFSYPASRCLQKPQQIEKIKAPPPPRRPYPNQSPAMRKLYDQNGLLHAQLRSMRALLKGRNRHPHPRLNPPQWNATAEYLAENDRKLDRILEALMSK